MVLVGAALGAYVWTAWPEPETRVVRLPYGEALPKRPLVVTAEQAPAEPVRDVGEVAGAVAEVELPEAEPVRVVAAAEPIDAPAPTRAPVYLAPRPVASDGDDDGYVENAEELGAEPLPGEGETDLTQVQSAAG
jgi:hypothetical protein